METMVMQNFGGQMKSIMVFLKVAYSAVIKNSAVMSAHAFQQGGLDSILSPILFTA